MGGKGLVDMFNSLGKGRFFSVNVAKLKYLATKRGIVENELIFQKFFAHGGGWDKLNSQVPSKEKEIQLLNEFLLEYDWDIFAWLSGQRPVPEPYKSSEMFKLIKESLKPQKNEINL